GARPPGGGGPKAEAPAAPRTSWGGMGGARHGSAISASPRTLLSSACDDRTREQPMHRLIFALSVSLMASTAFAASMSDMAARTELHTIDTLTLSDAQFLTGDANARATVTAGVLRIPRG